MSSSPPAEQAHAARRLWRGPYTLRTKLIAGFVTLIVAVCAVIGVVTEVFLSKYLVHQLDARLVSTQERFVPGGGPERTPPSTAATGGQQGSTDTETPPTGATGTPSPVLDTRFTCTDSGTVSRQPDGSLYAVVRGGTVAVAVLRESFSNCQNLPAVASSALASVVPNAPPVTVSLGAAGSYRVAARTTPDGDVQVTGLSMSDVSATQLRLAVIMAIVAGVAIVAGGVAVFWIVRRSVRPLERVAATAAQVSTLPLDRGEVDLGVRVPDRDTDPRTEVGQVGAALNQMLGHVSSALQARQASETRVRQFVADASHELRTPLAAIRGYSELARRGQQDAATIAHALGRVESESSRMSTLVDDLLLLARLDSGRPLAAEDVDLTMLVIDAVSDARVAGPDHKWRLDLPEDPVTTIGDPARLNQVLVNLLANARTHTPPGTVVVTGLAATGDDVVLTVADDGLGIPAGQQREVFGRFVRGDSSRSRAAGSTGLGLAIVSAVVSAHHGAVTLESRPGRTVFQVRLPCRPSALPEKQTSMSAGPPNQAATDQADESGHVGAPAHDAPSRSVAT